MVCKFCGKAQFPHSLEQIARNYDILCRDRNITAHYRRSSSKILYYWHRLHFQECDTTLNWSILLIYLVYLFFSCSLVISRCKFSVILLLLSQELLKGTFKKYIRSRFPSFDSPVPPPLVRPCLFSSTPPTEGTFILARTLSPSISLLVKFRENKLMMRTIIFGWTQRVFYKATLESL